MADDTNGFDISEVLSPISGKTFVKPATGNTLSTRSQMIDPAYTPANPAVQLPLNTEDGGPQFTNEDDGDDREYFQEGYLQKSGLFNATLELTYAGYDETLRQLQGENPDIDGYGIVKGGSSPKQWIVFYKGLYKAPGVDGLIVWNREGRCTVTVTENQETRGEDKTFTVVFKFLSDTVGLNSGIYHQAVLYPDPDPESV